MKKRNILTRATALAALLMGLATACTHDELAPNNPTDGGNGPLRLHSLTIEGASNATRAAIASGSFADGGADPTANKVRTAFKEGDEVTVVAVCSEEEDGAKQTTATLQPDGSWKMADENLLPGDGQEWTAAAVGYQSVDTKLTATQAATLFGGIATPAITINGDHLSADNEGTGGLTLVNGAITATLRHSRALLTIAPDAITIGGEFAAAGYTHIIGLRGSTNSVTDADAAAAASRFPFTAFDAPAGGEVHPLLQAIAPTSRLTTLHVRLAKGTTAVPTEATDWMEIPVLPDAKDENGNGSPGLPLTSNYRYKLALNLYNEGKMTVTVPTTYPSWGEEQEVENNIFFIKDATTLRQFATMINGAASYNDPVLTKNAIVTASFTINTTADEGGTGWDGIRNSNNFRQYRGTFDGQGHTITLVAPTGTPATQGLFASLGGGVVKNLTLQGTDASNPAYISNSNSSVGAIVGDGNEGGTVQNCHVRYLNIEGSSTGGIVGQCPRSIVVAACSATGCSLMGTGRVGGIVGFFDGGTIQNSYAAGNVITSTTQAKGLLVGDNNATMQNCAFITGDNGTGGTDGTLNAIGDRIGSGPTPPATVVGYTSATAFNTGAPATLNTGMPTIIGADGKEKIWVAGTSVGTAYPVLGDKQANTNDHMYIYNETDLRAFAALIKDANDGDLVLKKNATVMCSFTINTTADEGGTGWDGIINDNGWYYLGTFDGQGHTITLIAPSDTPATQGLFDRLGKGGVVKNITLQGTDASNPAHITGAGSDGAGIVGLNEGGTVQNCHVRYLNIEGSFIGGIVGESNSSSSIVTACSATGCSLKGTGDGYSVGGIVGLNSRGTVQNSYAAGITLANSAGASKGLLVGGNGGTVQNCAADSESAGGLIDLIGKDTGTDTQNNLLDPADFNTGGVTLLNVFLPNIRYQWAPGTAANGAYQDANSNYYPVTTKK